MAVKTVFVIGAGASSDVGLPTGVELRRLISSKLAFKSNSTGGVEGGDKTLGRALAVLSKQSGVPFERYLQAAREISAALPQQNSIDHYLRLRQGDGHVEETAKLAICSCILESEAASPLFVDQNNTDNLIEFDRLDNNVPGRPFPPWYNTLFRLLFSERDGALRHRLEDTAFIVFNYDRCLEQYLYYSFRNVQRMSPEEARSTVSHMHIYHAYGDVGPLFSASDSYHTKFGKHDGVQDLISRSTGIKTFNESINVESSEIVAIRSAVGSSETLIFLGFAYWDQNMNLITPDQNELADKGSFGTVFGESPSNQQVIADRLSQLTSELPPTLEECSGAELLNNYSRTLTERF